jgi:AsmA protein
MKFRIAVFAAVVVGIVAALAATLITRFDPDAAADEVRAFVRERYGRELRFEGPLSLSLWPVLSVAVPRATLSDVGSERQAASIERANVEIAWLPLLRGRVIVEHARVTGLHLSIEQRADGTRNIDNLIAPLSATPDAAPGDEPPARRPRIEIGKVELSEASIEYADAERGIVVWLDDIELKLDELDSKMVTPMSLRARWVSAPFGVSALVRVSGTLDIDPTKRTVGLRGAEMSVRGFKDGRPLDANARARRMSVTLGRPGLVGRLESFAIGLKTGGDDWAIEAAHARGAGLDYDGIRLTFAASGVEANARGRTRHGTFETSLLLPEVVIANPTSRGKPIDAALRWRGSQELDLKLTLDGLSGGVQNFSASRLTLSADATASALEAGLRLTGAIRADLDAASVNLGQIAGILTLDPGSGQPAIRLPLSGSIHTEGSARTIDADLETRLEASLMRLRTRYDPARAEGRLGVTLAADQLDLDRLDALLSPALNAIEAPARRTDTLIGRQAEKPAESGRANAPPVSTNARPRAATSDPVKQQSRTPAATLQRAAGGSWTADLQIGQLKADWVRAAGVRLSAQSYEAGFRIPALSLSMHGGTLTGQADFNRLSEHFTLSTQARAIDIAALLDTLGQPRRLEGLAEWRANLSGQISDAPLADSLRGEVALMIADGRLHGVDLARAVRDAAQRIRSGRDARAEATEDARPPTGTAASFTEFSRLAARFNLRDGKARSSDLLLETPIVRASGSGIVDLQQQAVEANFRVGLVAPGNDPLLAALNRLSVPVQVRGPLSQPEWRVDIASMLPPRFRR